MVLTLKDAAAFLTGIGRPYTEQTLRNAILKGELQGRKLGRDYVVEEADLLAWLATRNPNKEGRKPKGGDRR